MPNIAAVLKSEVARIARREVKQQTQAMQKGASSYRREITALKRRVQDLERALSRLSKGAQPKPLATAEAEAGGKHRFSAKGFSTLRKRLELSAADMGRLIGASGLSVYKWEQGKAQPRAKYLAAITTVRGIGKREAARRLQEDRK